MNSLRPGADEIRSAQLARRAQLAPGTAAGVTEEMIRGLVDAFYEVVRADPVLGPIFNARVADWGAHKAHLSDFWSSVTLMTGRFKGAPMAAHAGIPGAGAAEFSRWLSLWERTACAVCPPAAASLFVAKAKMIAQSLQLGIAAHRGELPPLAPAPAQTPETSLPAGAAFYARTPSFTAETVPDRLRGAHDTKPGVWGKIWVEAGELAYRIEDPRRPSSVRTLKPGEPPGIVEPTILHSVQPSADARFYVAFFK